MICLYELVSRVKLGFRQVCKFLYHNLHIIDFDNINHTYYYLQLKKINLGSYFEKSLITELNKLSCN